MSKKNPINTPKIAVANNVLYGHVQYFSSDEGWQNSFNHATQALPNEADSLFTTIAKSN